MPLQFFSSFNIGKDQALSIQIHNLEGGSKVGSDTDLFTTEDIGIFDNFSEDPQNNDVIVKAINFGGRSFARSTDDGTQFSFEITRQNSTPDVLANLLRFAYYAKGSGSVLATLHHVKYHPNGQAYGFMETQYPNSTLRCTNAGKWEGDNKVPLMFAGFCPLPIVIDANDLANTTNSAIATQLAKFMFDTYSAQG